MPYFPGDHWMICDVCGFKIRKSQARRRYDGAMVCDADWEPRHPQEIARQRAPDKISVPISRPEPTDYFLADGEVTSGDL